MTLPLGDRILACLLAAAAALLLALLGCDVGNAAATTSAEGMPRIPPAATAAIPLLIPPHATRMYRQQCPHCRHATNGRHDDRPQQTTR